MVSGDVVGVQDFSRLAYHLSRDVEKADWPKGEPAITEALCIGFPTAAQGGDDSGSCDHDAITRRISSGGREKHVDRLVLPTLYEEFRRQVNCCNYDEGIKP